MFDKIQKMTVIYLAVIFFVGLDRFFKSLALLSRPNEINLLGDILKFNFKANYYIAFSLPLAGPLLMALIVIITLGLIIVWLRELIKRDYAKLMPLALIILGAASNLFDRLKYGYVIDYLDLKYFTVFNLADAMIVAGIIFLFVIINKKQAY